MSFVTENGKNIDNYYNRFDADKNYKRVLLRDGYVTQASEMNELQDILINDRKKITDRVFSDGDIVQDGQVSIDAQSGLVRAQAGTVYLDGRMWDVPEAEFNIPTTGTVSIGVYLKTTIISEVEDEGLRNPAIGSRGEGLPGAWREKIEASWGFDGDGRTDKFYAIYTADDAILRAKETPPNYDSMAQAIAQYDQDSTGSGTYVSSGLVVSKADDDSAGNQVYNVGAGRYRVRGLGFEFKQDQRIVYPAAPKAAEIVKVVTETVDATGADTQRINVAHTPIWLDAAIGVSVPRQVTRNIVHALASGGMDALDPGSVLRIVSVTQGNVTYVEGTDFRRVGDQLDWSLSGAEPSPGSTYEVTYDYYASEAVTDADYDGFSVEDAVAGHAIIYTYSYALPRIDRLCVDNSGRFQWLNGVASSSTPLKPAVPQNLLALATVRQTWREFSERTLTNDGVRCVLFDDMLNMQEQITWLGEQLARTRLENDISAREAGAKVGLLVDPFQDDSIRDAGVEQDAAIVNGWLTLPIKGNIYPLAELAKPVVLPYSLSVALQQTQKTGSMKINPYQNFDPLPADVTLSPAVDRWNETATRYTSSETKNFYQTARVVRGGHFSAYTVNTSTTTSSTSQVGTSTSAATYLRQIQINYKIKGFFAGEILDHITFDGLNVAFTGDTEADENGELSGSFTIPPKVTTGTKAVVFTGRGGTIASGTFTGEGTITYRILKTTYTVTHLATTYVDPLAQTFCLSTPAQIAAVDLWFTKKGNSKVTVRIVETANGFPTKNILAEGSIEASAISTNSFTRIFFKDYYQAVLLQADTEYAIVVMTDDAQTEVATATLGDFDRTTQTAVRSQPYTVGVLLSSSNASTWTAHQNSDLCFRLLEAKATSNELTVDLGSVTDIADVTDLILYAATEIPESGAGVKFTLVMPDGSSMDVAEEQTVSLAEEISGDIGVRATLTNIDKLSPAVATDSQLVIGKLQRSATYVSRTISAVDATKLSVIFDAILPSGSGVVVEVQKDGGEWEALELDSSVNQGDGEFEYKYVTQLSNVQTVKLRLTLNGTPAARPWVADLRMLATK